MKILILGHGQHGKDSAANLLKTKYGFKFASSSEFVFERIVWPKLWHYYLSQHDLTVLEHLDEATREIALRDAKNKCYDDRRNRREQWRKIISDYTAGDKTRLAREILAENDIYVGQRAQDEYDASRHLFDLVFWIHRIGRKYNDPSMKINFDPATMHPIVNVEDKGQTMLDQMSKYVEQVLHERA